jgi:hypothetical protein
MNTTSIEQDRRKNWSTRDFGLKPVRLFGNKLETKDYVGNNIIKSMKWFLYLMTIAPYHSVAKYIIR